MLKDPGATSLLQQKNNSIKVGQERRKGRAPPGEPSGTGASWSPGDITATPGACPFIGKKGRKGWKGRVVFHRALKVWTNRLNLILDKSITESRNIGRVLVQKRNLH